MGSNMTPSNQSLRYLDTHLKNKEYLLVKIDRLKRMLKQEQDKIDEIMDKNGLRDEAFS